MYRPNPNRSKNAIERARQARAKPSAAEAIVWKLLRNERIGFKFRREYPILQYRIDFFCPEARLGVEFDGEQHDLGRDAVRDREIEAIGIEVLRIPNRSFFNLDREVPIDYLRLILTACERRTGKKGIAFWE